MHNANEVHKSSTVCYTSKSHKVAYTFLGTLTSKKLTKMNKTDLRNYTTVHVGTQNMPKKLVLHERLPGRSCNLEACHTVNVVSDRATPVSEHSSRTQSSVMQNTQEDVP